MKVAQIFIKSFWVVAICFDFTLASNCTTPTNKSGNCISLLDCNYLLSAVRNSVNDIEIRKYIRDHQCATYPRPMFCCPIKIRFQNKIGEISNKLPKAKDGICGRTFEDNLPRRIVGGERALLGEFPWTAMLIYLKSTNNSGSHCGGSLITNQHVLSAAHCVDPRSFPIPTWKLTKIRLGEFDLETDVDCDQFEEFYYCSFPPLDFDVKDYFIHERYVSSEQGNPHDVAVIRMSESVTYTNFIKPVCLPITNEDYVNIDYGTVTVAGFGRTESKGYSTRLLKAEVDILERNECTAQYRSQGRQIKDTQICALRANTDACNGDSGNALIKQHDTTRVMYQIGIVSYGPRKCGQVFPGIYINVMKFIDWIKNKVEI